MEYIDVIYGRSNWKPISLLIQIRTLSHWSHIGAILPDGRIVEAVGGLGVIITTMEAFTARYSDTIIERLPVVSRDEAYRYLKNHIGYVYDTRAAISYLFALGWDVPYAKHCSELIAGCTGYFNPLRLNEITPSILRKLST